MRVDGDGRPAPAQSSGTAGGSGGVVNEKPPPDAMSPANLESVLDEIQRDPPTVVCLPDLFLDHVVEVPSWDEADQRVRSAIDRGGGNLLDTSQAIHPGGNAANTAWALARLDVRVQLAGVTGPRLVPLFEATLGQDGVDLACVDAIGAPSLTTVLSVGDPPANAMMNEPGALAGLGPEDLTPDVQALIEAADAMLVANWASMADHGTAFVAEALQIAARAGTTSYLDAADPTERTADERVALLEMLEAGELDVWAMNEHEARTFAGVDETDVAARRLAKRTGTTVDVHTHERAASFSGRSMTSVDAFDVGSVHRTTGAGDAFNAGNLIGYLAGIPPDERLELAHAVAGRYVSQANRRPPTDEDVAAFAAAVSR